jgi:multicomponent K+:H+ antiporter subunit G
MTEAIPVLGPLLTALLLIGGATITLIGTLGLLRLRTFYQRAHAATLGTTLGTACVALASMIHSSALEGWLVLHELLVIAFVTVTTPISLIVLVGAAVSRDRSGNGGDLAARMENEHR